MVLGKVHLRHFNLAGRIGHQAQLAGECYSGCCVRPPRSSALAASVPLSPADALVLSLAHALVPRVHAAESSGATSESSEALLIDASALPADGLARAVALAAHCAAAVPTPVSSPADAEPSVDPTRPSPSYLALRPWTWPIDPSATATSVVFDALGVNTQNGLRRAAAQTAEQGPASLCYSFLFFYSLPLSSFLLFQSPSFPLLVCFSTGTICVCVCVSPLVHSGCLLCLGSGR